MEKKNMHYEQKEIECLYEKLKNGDNFARKEILAKTYYLTHFCAKRWINGGVSREDLISIGTLGLIKAVDTYSIVNNILFSTYAYICINNEISNFFRKYNKHLEKTSVSTDEPITESGDITVQDLLFSSECIEEDYCDKMQIETLRKLVYELPEQERFIILNYYGFDNLEKMELKDIAKIIGYSPSKASRKLTKTKMELKKQLTKLGYTTDIYARTR